MTLSTKNPQDLSGGQVPDGYIPPRDRAALDTDQAAQYIGLSVHTLRKYRALGEGPAYARMARKIVYRIKDLDDYVESRLVR